MWKYLVLLVLVQRRTILSQPVIDENIREARQLNFGDCCPCPGFERNTIRDQDVFESQMQEFSSRDDCPCRTASDSKAASSILKPAMRTVEPFSRSGETNVEPKPLLKPEVGLASSVLETLREVTDQEYQEALARDAARSAVDATEGNSFEQETSENEPRNIVNIILKPKQDQIDDALPEASHLQETRCIHSPLGQSNLDESVVHSVPLFRNSLFSSPNVQSKGLLHRKLFDMDNSASNLQENILMPLKSNILDDLKLKSDLIKLKLFPGIGHNLKAIKSESDNARLSNLRLPSLMKSKDKEYLPLSSIENIEEKESDTMYSPSYTEKYGTNNNERSNNNLQTILPPKMSIKELDTSVQAKPTTYFNTDKENLKSFTDNAVLSERSDCKLNEDNPNSNIINSIDPEISDIFSSPSEIIESKSSISSEVPEKRMSDEQDTVDNDNEQDDQNKFDDNKQLLTTDIEEVIPTNFNECLSNENTEIDQINLNNFIGDDITPKSEESLCNVEDSDVEASINNPQIISLQEEENKYVDSNDSNEPRNVNTENIDDQQSNDISTIITTTQKIFVNSSPKPSIKGNILKTIENLKKSNERIQEKIKSNVQDALQLLVVKNNNLPKADSLPVNDLNKDENNTGEKNIDLQDLQEMSNRILNLSTLKENEVDASIQSRENLTKDIKHHDEEQAGDNNQEASKLNIKSSSMELPSDIFKSTINTPKTSIETPKELMQRSNIEELQDTPRNILQNSCDSMYLKSSDPVETEADSLDGQSNEMFSEASSPIVSSVPHVVQPNTNSDVKVFFENLKTSVSDIFSGNRERNDNSITDALFTKSEQPSYNGHLVRSSNDKFRKVKNHKSNINLYKAKVAVPESINIKALPASISRESNTLSKSYKESPEMIAASNTLRQHMHTLSPFNIKTKFDKSNQRRDSSDLQPRNLNSLQNLMPSSDHFRSLTENTLRSIQGAFDETLNNTFQRSRNKLVSKERSVDLFGSMAKTNDEFSEKFRALHSDLNDRLSSFSQKISNFSPLNVRTTNYSPTTKSRTSLLGTEKTALKPNNLNRALSTSETLSKPKLLHKLNIPSKLAIDSTKIPTITRPTKLDDIRSSLRKDIKLKPLKESKVTISFTTTSRPKLVSKTKTSYVPSSTKSKTSLSTKTSSLKRPEIKSKLQTDESKALASEQVASRVPFSERRYVNARKLSPLQEETSDLDEINARSNSESEEAVPNERKNGNSMLSKIREAVKARANESTSNKIINNNMLSSRSESDALLSASNLNSMVLEDKPLKENVSYRCKMTCFEDGGNS